MRKFDDAVVGAGILGLAHAYALANRGRSVVVLERSPRAEGASVRNFGMIWPIGQPSGPMRSLALRSRDLWRQILGESGLWHDRAGSLHLAYRDDEAQVLDEFAASSAAEGLDCDRIGPDQVLKLAPAVKRDDLICGLYSRAEMGVDPREIVAKLPGWLAEKHNVTFEFGRAVIGYDRPRVISPGVEIEADRLWVCSGDDLRTLYPDHLAAAGLVRCKLQMMRTPPMPQPWKLGPLLAAGLTLRHYRSFESCPTLPSLRDRLAAEWPDHVRFGIHVMAAQNGLGELILGDSHEYGDPIDPFDKAEIDDLILAYLATFLDIPDLRIASRWHGSYAKHPTSPYVTFRPEPGVSAVAAVGGAGMTLSFGLAEQVVGSE